MFTVSLVEDGDGSSDLREDHATRADQRRAHVPLSRRLLLLVLLQERAGIGSIDTGPNVYICDEDVEVCVEVIREGHKTVFVPWAHRDHWRVDNKPAGVLRS